MGGGRKESDLKEKAEETNLLGKNIFFIERKPPEKVKEYLSLSDAALLILKDMKLLNITLPAKIQSYFAFGIPVIACCNGEGANIVKDADAGMVCPAEDSKRLAETAIKLYNSEDKDKNNMRDNAKKYFNEHYTKKFLIDKLEEVIR